MKRVILALDVGTSSMRTIVFSLAGTVLHQTSFEYHTVFPKPSYVEQDPGDWREAAIETLSGAAVFLQKNEYEPMAISVTSQRASMIPMDETGSPMRNAIMWQDKRTIPVCEGLIAQYGMESLYRKTGLRSNPLFVLNKIIWLRENEPEIFRRAKKFIGVQDYVVYQLTEEYVTDWTQASRTMLMDLSTFRWDEDLLKIAGITPDRLCRLVPPGSVAGGLSPAFARLCDLPAGLPVIVSGGDQQNAAIALGVVKTGVAEANTGTGSFVLSFSDKPVFEKDCRVLCQASAMAGNWMAETAIFNTGAIFRWFKERFCPELRTIPEPYPIMTTWAAESPVGSRGVMMLPHFEGSAAPYWNPKAKGIFFNLGLSTTRADMIRSILEGIALEIEENLGLMRGIIGPIGEVSVAGGLTRSDLFCAIQSNVYNATVLRTKNPEASALGASINAGVTLGVYESHQDAVQKMLGIPEKFEPDPYKTEIYDRLALRRNQLYNALNDADVYSAFMGNV